MVGCVILKPPVVAAFQIKINNYEAEKDCRKAYCDDVEMCLYIEEIVHTFYTSLVARRFQKAAPPG